MHCPPRLFALRPVCVAVAWVLQRGRGTFPAQGRQALAALLAVSAAAVSAQVSTQATAPWPAEPAASAAAPPPSVVFKRGNVTIQADQIQARLADERLKAIGHVSLEREGDRFTGAELDLDTAAQTGYVLSPQFLFGRTRAGGRAERIDFLGPQRFSALRTTYSSCPIDEDRAPDWQLSTRRLTVNLAENEGIAEGAVLRFLGVPILAAPVLSFPVTDERKSGLLPPVVNLSTTSGFEFGTPYYLNLAPNHDATLTPIWSTRRGLGLGSEFRYLTPDANGDTRLFLLPNDLTNGERRWAFRGQHAGRLPAGAYYEANWLRASDDDYWRDGLRGADSLTPRLLGTHLLAEQRRTWSLGAAGEAEQVLYARATQWQLLQDLTASSTLQAPYRRRPQVGARWRALQGPMDWSLETEFNHFTHQDPTLPEGSRAHLLGAVALPLGDAGWQVTPRLGLNAAAYDVSATASTAAVRRLRAIPTLSLDSQWTFDRETTFRDLPVTQTLEPRLLYVRTPWRQQADLPTFDSAALDFNPTSVYAPSAFSGIDRVSDAHQLTAGVSTRLIRRDDGSEMARLGVAQRFLFSDQRITPDGTPLTKQSSDVLVFGSTNALQRWHLDGVVQYNPEIDRVARSILNLRYSPGPFRTLSASYRFQRSASEQLALGWQWPLWGTRHDPLWPANAPVAPVAVGADRPARPDSSACQGTLYGVGRLEYSLRDRRTAGVIAGLEYDAGCWIGRVVAQRKSTGEGAQSTSLSVQLELIGLARLDLGSNPLTLLKDNVPGFRLLNDGAAGTPGSPAATTDPP